MEENKKIFLNLIYFKFEIKKIIKSKSYLAPFFLVIVIVISLFLITESRRSDTIQMIHENLWEEQVKLIDIKDQTDHFDSQTQESFITDIDRTIKTIENQISALSSKDGTSFLKDEIYKRNLYQSMKRNLPEIFIEHNIHSNLEISQKLLNLLNKKGIIYDISGISTNSVPIIINFTSMFFNPIIIFSFVILILLVFIQEMTSREYFFMLEYGKKRIFYKNFSLLGASLLYLLSYLIGILGSYILSIIKGKGLFDNSSSNWSTYTNVTIYDSYINYWKEYFLVILIGLTVFIFFMYTLSSLLLLSKNFTFSLIGTLILASILIFSPIPYFQNLTDGSYMFLSFDKQYNFPMLIICLLAIALVCLISRIFITKKISRY